jgi:hypothetical protein
MGIGDFGEMLPPVWLFDPEEEGTTLHRNAGNYSPLDTA